MKIQCRITMLILGTTATLLSACRNDTSVNDTIRLITLDPGHFHAALVQKSMYPGVDTTVYVYAPAGPDLNKHLDRIAGYNSRTDSPTHWNTVVYTREDFLEEMIKERKGNVVVLAGNNQSKTDYILQSVQAGYHVLADKPMAIDQDGFEKLQEAFKTAAGKKLLLYDIMTERSEITTILQKELSQIPEIFGTLEQGSPEDPAVTKESVHHFYKYVSGKVNIRPAWFFDVKQQGEGIVDVTTHLVDLVQWECFPEQIIDAGKEISLVSAVRFPTMLSKAEFCGVTGLNDYPPFLAGDVTGDSMLRVFANGEIIYQIRGVYAKVSVRWAYKAPDGAGDTHYSLMRGTKASLVIRQGMQQQYNPILYIVPANGYDGSERELALNFEPLRKKYPGIALEKAGNEWIVRIPEKYHVGHEAHFAEVMERFIQYYRDGKLPDWEVPNMLAKYYVTTGALKIARTANTDPASER
ncbi:MAG: putative oxidoreductase C-terminal domain-containing protein [Bacteroidales bacterium]